MFETTLSYQKSGYIDNGWIMPMPEPEISRKKEVILDSAILDALESYAQILRHSEESILFREFLLTDLNNKHFGKTYPRGLYVDDKTRLKELIQENIPDDVKQRYWNINDGENINYVKPVDFKLFHAEHINGLIKETNDLEQRLEFEKQMEEFSELTPMDPREYDAITEYLKDYSEEEAISRWSEDSVNEVLYSDE